ncbi:hypothetical protein QN277_022539 [Acacia crassicarpa]|uniref:Uncharacterized protein n=1 Tax=Acacia crassicarpa TaxID=499986 RepID=A0AAE1KBS0_9FABA|nr:hypothetical protein QN277_022539 [Acacia crassicarpa]
MAVRGGFKFWVFLHSFTGNFHLFHTRDSQFPHLQRSFFFTFSFLKNDLSLCSVSLFKENKVPSNYLRKISLLFLVFESFLHVDGKLKLRKISEKKSRSSNFSCDLDLNAFKFERKLQCPFVNMN